MSTSRRLLCVAPYRVYPPVTGANLLVDGVNRALAGKGWKVNLFSTGIRRHDLLGSLCSTTRVAPGYTVYNHATPFSVLRNWGSRQSTGVPPLGIEGVFRSLRSRRLREWLESCDLIQVEHPFGCSAIAARKRPETPLVMVAHNVEATLAESTLAHLPEVVKKIDHQEREALSRADAVIVLTEADREEMMRRYGVGADRIHVIPVGVDLERFYPASNATRATAKARLGLSGKTVAVFAGARFGPNLEAAAEIERMAAETALPEDLVFLIIGRIGEVMTPGPRITVTGFVDDVIPYLHAGDLAFNPMRSGGGMHLKMLEFLSLGLPVVSTGVGLRGLGDALPEGVLETDLAHMPESLATLVTDPDRHAAWGAANRDWVAARYGWSRIAEQRAEVYRSLMNKG
ncbi:MAG: glycosyltransferase family 4 protein [Leptospirillia bacterium]